MKLYAENYVWLDFGERQQAFFMIMDGLISGYRSGEKAAATELLNFYDRYRKANGIDSVVGLVTLPETNQTLMAVFPLVNDAHVYVLQYDAEVDRHYIFIDDVASLRFNRAELQAAVSGMEGNVDVLY